MLILRFGNLLPPPPLRASLIVSEPWRESDVELELYILERKDQLIPIDVLVGSQLKIKFARFLEEANRAKQSNFNAVSSFCILENGRSAVALIRTRSPFQTPAKVKSDAPSRVFCASPAFY